MNIEDKARSLVDSFESKDLAVIAVNEILNITLYSSTEDNDYWKAVKYEIIKM